jgi:hypothetical protein
MIMNNENTKIETATNFDADAIFVNFFALSLKNLSMLFASMVLAR